MRVGAGTVNITVQILGPMIGHQKFNFSPRPPTLVFPVFIG